MDADVLERTFREMRAADQMRSAQAEQKQEKGDRPSFWQVSAEAARETVSDPMRAGSVFAEAAYAIEDIRQKVVEAPTYGQEVTPSLHDGRLTQANAEHASPHQQGSDPLMRAYAERRELTAADLYGRAPDQEKDREQQQVRGGIER